MEYLRWALTLKPGDLINDCSSFNVVIKKIYIEKFHIPKSYIKEWNKVPFHTRNGWYIGNIDFTNEIGGHCSLMSCGVEKPKSREVIEADCILNIKEYFKEGGQAEHWYGKDTERFKLALEKGMRKIYILESGAHICDERGVFLEKYREL
jgi:hypothetical protein